MYYLYHGKMVPISLREAFDLPLLCREAAISHTAANKINQGGKHPNKQPK